MYSWYTCTTLLLGVKRTIHNLLGKDNPPAYTTSNKMAVQPYTCTVLNVLSHDYLWHQFHCTCINVQLFYYHCMYTLHVEIWWFIIVSRINNYNFLKWRYISDLTHCVKIIGEEICKIDYLVSNNECVFWEQYNLARKAVSFPCGVSGDKYYTLKNCYNFVHFGKLCIAPGIALEICSHTSFSDISVTFLGPVCSPLLVW